VRVRREAEFGFDIDGGVVGEETCGSKNRSESTGESITNEVVRTHLADVFALKNVITEDVDSVAAGAARRGDGMGEKREPEFPSDCARKFPVRKTVRSNAAT
jgi:hypothetical protein